MSRLNSSDGSYLLRDPVAMQTYINLINNGTPSSGGSEINHKIVNESLGLLGYFNEVDYYASKRPQTAKKKSRTDEFQWSHKGEKAHRQAHGGGSVHRKHSRTPQATHLEAPRATTSGPKKTYGDVISRKLWDNKVYGGAYIMKPHCDVEYVSRNFRSGPFASTKIGNEKKSTLRPWSMQDKASNAAKYRDGWSTSDFIQRNGL